MNACAIVRAAANFVLYLGVALVASACGPSADSPRQASHRVDAIQLELEATFGLSDEFDGLSSVTSVVVDDSGRVYVLDAERSHKQLVSFSEAGDVLWSLDQEGVAPGELRYVLGFAWDGDEMLYLANQFGSRIDRIRLDGSYVDSKSTAEIGPARLAINGWLESGSLIMTWPVYGELGIRVYVVRPDEQWAIADSFSVIRTGDFEVLGGISIPPLVSTLRDEIVAGHLTKYQYSLHSEGGDVVREFERPDVTMQAPAISESSMGISFSQLSYMFPIVEYGQGKLLGGGSWPTTTLRDPIEYLRSMFNGRPSQSLNTHRSLDLFDATTGQILASADAEDFGIKRLLTSDSRGRIYAELTGDRPAVGKFRILE